MSADRTGRDLRLGIDTSTDVRVGLADDTGVLASRAVTDPRAHAEQLMPLVVATLAGAGRVRLVAFPSALATLVPQALARLERSHPGVSATAVPPNGSSSVPWAKARRMGAIFARS